MVQYGHVQKVAASSLVSLQSQAWAASHQDAGGGLIHPITGRFILPWSTCQLTENLSPSR